jgi:hypothetical protein
MLAAVLLHVIVTARPIHHSSDHGSLRDGTIGPMPDLSAGLVRLYVLYGNFKDGSAAGLGAQKSLIAGLPAAFGIKSGAVKSNLPYLLPGTALLFPDIGDPRLKFHYGGIGFE